MSFFFFFKLIEPLHNYKLVTGKNAPFQRTSKIFLSGILTFRCHLIVVKSQHYLELNRHLLPRIVFLGKALLLLFLHFSETSHWLWLCSSLTGCQPWAFLWFERVPSLCFLNPAASDQISFSPQFSWRNRTQRSFLSPAIARQKQKHYII